MVCLSELCFISSYIGLRNTESWELSDFRGTCYVVSEVTSGPFSLSLSLLTSLGNCYGHTKFLSPVTPKGLSQELFGTLSGPLTDELRAFWIHCIPADNVSPID